LTAGPGRPATRAQHGGLRPPPHARPPHHLAGDYL